MKIIFDSNIFISAFVIPGSKAEKAILRVIEGNDTLLISKEIIKEILEVLSTKFQRDREAISHVAVYLSDIAQEVNPTKRIHIFKDDPDNRILECAFYGKADAIVTGDKEMLKLKEYKGIKVISLKE
ncbi:MAG: putative nucleic acid-binding protein, contains PIN domain [Candidatus Jettenia ecosi]|uniref:Putative nucleic acid-binding protein, contains PIN domain n=1 Tax=Candidatus Jettenia ecosi TaxID=2494326 RepID=A0A533Q7H8_9BACT|nr:MAG: putative nucleic acid-binding protein, contains PIN domain [Candidatus Jettenia ecosi]